MTAARWHVLGGPGPVAVGQGGAKGPTELALDVAALVARIGQDRGPGPVLVTTTDRYAFVVACFAAWESGRRVLLPRNLQPSTVEDAAQSAAAVIGPGAIDPLPVSAPRVLPSACRLPEPDTVIVTVHTSGTTGAGRGVHKTAAQLLGEARVLAGAFDLEGGRPVLSTVPPHHVYGLLFGVLVPLLTGAPFVRETPLHPEAVAAAARSSRADILVGTPAHLRGFEVLDRDALAPVRRVFSSGAPLAPATAKMLAGRFGVSVIEVLGSTETGGIAHRVASDGAGPWTPLPGVHVSAEPDGRIRLSSPFLAADAVKPTVGDDRIVMLEDGRFQHLGRIDDVVKVGGRRISLADMEQTLLGLPGIHDAALHAEPTAAGRGVRVRAAVATDEPDWTPATVRDALARWFDPVTLPRTIRVAPALPRDPSGKLPRERLGAWLDGTDAPLLDAVVPDDAARQVTLTVAVPASAPHFVGHFPGEPIFPAVAQVDTVVLEAVRRIWPALGEPVGARRLKFRRPMRPGATARLELDRTDGSPTRVAFELIGPEEVFASGMLEFRGPDGGTEVRHG